MSTRKKNLIFLICYLSYTSIYVARVNLSMASPGLMDTGLLDTAQIGMMGSIFSIIYACGRFINGQISDRQPPWLMISIGLAAAGLSNLFIGFFPPFLAIFLLWGINAFAQSMLWSSVLCAVSNMHDEATARKKTTYLVTSVATGNILGIILNTFLINTWGLRFAFVVPGALTIFFGAMVLLTMRNQNTKPVAAKDHISMLQLIRNRKIRLVMIPAILHGTMKDNISLWMTVFFVDRFLIDLSQSAYFVLLIPVIGFFGRMIYPACYKLCHEQEHKVSVYAFFVCVAAALVLAFVPAGPLPAAICLSLIYTAVSVINTSILSIFPLRFAHTGNVASVSGIADFATYLGAGISSLAYGFLIKLFGYTPMFLSWALFSVLSIFFLRVLLTQQKEEA